MVGQVGISQVWCFGQLSLERLNILVIVVKEIVAHKLVGVLIVHIVVLVSLLICFVMLGVRLVLGLKFEVDLRARIFLVRL